MPNLRATKRDLTLGLMLSPLLTSTQRTVIGGLPEIRLASAIGRFSQTILPLK